MQRRLGSTLQLACLASIVGSALVVSACARPSSPSEPDAAVRDPARDPARDQAASGSAAAGADGAITGNAAIAQQLPAELVAELRQQGSDANGRLLTLAASFIATAECSDCGAPSYLWFLAVRCADPQHCEVLTEQCEGRISREQDAFTIELRAVEGGDEQLCAGYSGVFEQP